MNSSSGTSKYSKNALLAYKSVYNHKLGFTQVNTFLRMYNIADSGNELNRFTNDVTTRRISRIIKSIDKQLISLDKPITLYRGMSKKYYDVALQTGVLVNKAFLSTASKLESAEGFGNNGIVVQFNLPTHIKSYTYPSPYNDEHEVLVERNTQFINFTEPIKKENYILVTATISKYHLPSKEDVSRKLSSNEMEKKETLMKHILSLTKDSDDESSDFEH